MTQQQLQIQYQQRANMMTLMQMTAAAKAAAANEASSSGAYGSGITLPKADAMKISGNRLSYPPTGQQQPTSTMFPTSSQLAALSSSSFSDANTRQSK
jgi:hypothetical protein